MDHHIAETIVTHLQRVVSIVILLSIAPSMAAEKENRMEWKKLSLLSDPTGFAGQFVGVSKNRLLLVGGSNFPSTPVWDGGVKVWYHDVFALDDLEGEWKKIGAIDESRPVGYGVSISTDDGLLCIGGADATRHFDCVFYLNYDPQAPAGKQLSIRDLPPLPRTCGYCNGARVGDVVYVAGGLEHPKSQRAMKTFWSLDLNKIEEGWQELEPWPGPARHLSVAASLNGAFYLMSGVDLWPGPDAIPLRVYHRDLYRYTPGEGWTKLADLPQSVVAAPSPAMTSGDEIILFGGDDGRTLGFRPPDKHPGFPRTMWAYYAKQDAWRQIGEPPFVPVAVPLVPWKEGYVCASGEVRPGVRSREVWFVKP